MKLKDYIKHLQDLHHQYGDVDVKINTTYECSDLSINDTYSDAEKPYYDNNNNCIVIHNEFKSFD